jgi:hypothetical protein
MCTVKQKRKIKISNWYAVAANSYIYTEVKIQLTLEQTTKAQRGSRGISLLFT